ncbi:hypothetical protein [Nostoc sp.]|uniref:hypothetical protein n=1 Tax=Nostoc sp. TaxID=1180 RepID=UPI002FF7DEED
MNFPIIFIQVCHSHNPLEWTIIIAIVGAILAGSGIAATGILSISSTVITMLIAGTSMETISAAIGAMFNTISATTASVQLVAILVNGVKSILGC